jgi:hypothetical protein
LTFRIDVSICWQAGRKSHEDEELVQEVCQMRDLENTRIKSSDEQRYGAGTPSRLAEAERQLAAFHQAVLSLHGPEEAQKASEDWLRELETAAPNEPIHWRHISLVAADRLASRLVGNEHGATLGRSWQMIQRGTRQLLQCAQPCEAR